MHCIYYMLLCVVCELQQENVVAKSSQQAANLPEVRVAGFDHRKALTFCEHPSILIS